jgi:predicted nucleic acid-binding protein
MNVYADTSLLVSYYVNDQNSGRAQALIHSLTDPLFFTGLHRLELRNAFALGVFRQRLTAPQAQAAWRDIERDLQAGRLSPRRLNWPPIFRTAAQLASRHTPSIGSRSLDILHVAAAKKLAAAEFFSFDERQKALGQLLGLTVKP